MISSADIVFTPAQESDFEAFYALRLEVMREHYERQGLVWHKASQRRRHRVILKTEGLRRIAYQNAAVGFVAVQHDPKKDRVVIGRFCLWPTHQKQGLGTAVMQKIMAEPAWAGKTFFLDVLLKNPVRGFYERLGFRQTHETKILAYYEKAPS